METKIQQTSNFAMSHDCQNRNSFIHSLIQSVFKHIFFLIKYLKNMYLINCGMLSVNSYEPRSYFHVWQTNSEFCIFPPSVYKFWFQTHETNQKWPNLVSESTWGFDLLELSFPHDNIVDHHKSSVSGVNTCFVLW